MSRLWVKRALALVAIWLVVCGSGFVAGLDPQPGLIAGLLIAAAALWWLVADLGGLAEPHPAALPAPASWHAEEPLSHLTRGEDHRLMALQRMLAKTADRDVQARILYPTLLAIVDDRLLAHGVDRVAQPGRARALLGDDLADYLDRTHAMSPTDPRHLGDLLTRIERL